jgi:hypothetical protein
MHPWVAEQLVENRMAESERAASGRRRRPGARSGSTPVEAGSHRRPARLVGTLLIGAGRRLAGPDALAAALDASRIERGHSPA